MCVALASAVAACGTSTMHVAPDSSRPGGNDSYAVPAESAPPGSHKSNAGAGSASGPSFPKCAAEESAKAKFPERTNGADYRAIVRLTIAADGRPQDLCMLLVEGAPELEDKATEGITDKRYNPEYAGQKRDVVVTYKYQPAASAAGH